MSMSKLIAYFRVSTEKQGASKLGLEAQRAAVMAHAKDVGATIEASFTEIESGKRADRPELAKAIAHARRIKARLRSAMLCSMSLKNAVFTETIDQPIIRRENS